MMHQHVYPPHDFWKDITEKGYWQVAVALITAFAVAYFTNLYAESRANKVNIREAISDFKRYNYELQQTISNRHQSEIFSNYYSVYQNLHPSDDSIKVQHQKHINEMPELSMKVSEKYGQVVKSISLLEQLLPNKKLKKLEKKFEKILYHPTLPVAEPSLGLNDQQLNAYRDESIQLSKEWVNKNIKLVAHDVYKILVA
jgi:hypothetical protein